MVTLVTSAAEPDATGHDAKDSFYTKSNLKYTSALLVTEVVFCLSPARRRGTRLGAQVE